MELHHKNILKDHKLSLTAVRMAVLQALQEHPHSEAEHIFNLVKNKIATASKQAIYNNLNTLVEYRIIREIKPMGRLSLYETRVDDNHHHIICRHCEAIMDTDCFGSAPCLKPMDSHGFVVGEAEVIFWGICPSCQKSLNKKEGK